jgi:hypothetical protein
MKDEYQSIIESFTHKSTYIKQTPPPTTPTTAPALTWIMAHFNRVVTIIPSYTINPVDWKSCTTQRF